MLWGLKDRCNDVMENGQTGRYKADDVIVPLVSRWFNVSYISSILPLVE